MDGIYHGIWYRHSSFLQEESQVDIFGFNQNIFANIGRITMNFGLQWIN